ncbi:S-norcoclaurine synthase 2 [Camellia lanceoleosa]|uniref:S-norcoclaurine synthase 2 n=1 Tax=Camellia lanceoleosa TaxID=1840588 RepID=A0ACC0J0A6_9ERIC|nr:S-norcoclaurine synthase 2 [Camellia lanceoleosa]
MLGRVSEELEVNVPASQAWELYGTLQLAKFIGEELPNVVDKIEVVQGDGGVGTILNIIFPPGRPGFSSYKEKFTKVDDEKRVKETEVVEGGYLDFGFSLFRVRLEIIEKGEESCITRSTIEYEVKEDAAAAAATNANASSMVSIQPLVMIMEAASNYLMNLKNNNKNKIGSFYGFEVRRVLGIFMFLEQNRVFPEWISVRYSPL